MRTTAELVAFIEGQSALMRLLRLLDDVGLPDSWIGGGCIRNAVWDCMQGSPTSAGCDDVDVIYFDSSDALPERDERIEASLYRLCAGASWSVKNQARMHRRNGDRPYSGSADAVWHWPETSSAIAVRSLGGRTEVIAPYGVDDLINGVVRPTQAVQARMAVYHRRIRTKDWVSRWSNLTVFA